MDGAEHARLHVELKENLAALTKNVKALTELARENKELVEALQAQVFILTQGGENATS